MQINKITCANQPIKPSEFSVQENEYTLLKYMLYILRGENKYTGNYFFICQRIFYICITIVDIIVKNIHLRIICNNFQEILSNSKEM